MTYSQTRYVVKEILGFTWRKLCLRAPPVLKQKNHEQRLQTAQLMLTLRKLGFELVFIDEYAMSDNAVKPYGWAKPGMNDYIVHATRKECIQTVVALTEIGVISLLSK